MKQNQHNKRENHGLSYSDYIRAVNAAVGRVTLDKIIYYSGFDKNLNESEVKSIITLANERIRTLNQARRAEQIRRNNRNIANIQA